jgi:hypothetical protein
LRTRPAYRLSPLIARLCFRGIHVPQKGSGAWFKVLVENRRVIFRIVVDCLSNWKSWVSRIRFLRRGTAKLASEAVTPARSQNVIFH